MSGIKDTATVTLNVNGAQAKQMMSELESQIKKTETKITSLKANMADPKDVEKARKQLQNYKKQLEEMKSATEGVNKALGNLDVASPRQLEKALKTLNKQLKDLTPGTEVWDSHVERIKELKARLSEIREELAVQESWWDKLKRWVNDSGATILALGLGLDEVVGTLREYVDAFATMDQEMANVRKFTGLTAEQVAELNEEFKKLDTRTSREDLNKLAQEAGRLGKTSKEDILGFVRAADVINVALDDLGKGATLTLSKLTGIFGDEAVYGTEQSLLKVGSVINELSQNCSASAPYLADFASRMGGVGAQAGMTIQQIMGFAAVLSENNLLVEASSTALSQVIVRMMQEPAKYAKVAGLDVKRFTKLLKDDTNAALILLLETLEKVGGMNVLSPMFKEMGENGSSAIAALSTLAKHIDKVKEQQEVANIAFKEGASVMKEYEIQNSTVQATIDKYKNKVAGLRAELGERLLPLTKYFFTSGSAIMKGLLILVRFIDENKVAIVTLALATSSYIAIAKLHALWLDRLAVKTLLVDKANKVLAFSQKALAGVWAATRLGAVALANGLQYLRNGLEVTYAMQERWRKAMAAMKFTTWTGLLLVLASAIYLISRRYREAAESAQTLNKIKKDAISKLGEERSSIELLVGAAKDETLSLEERKRAIDKLNGIIPEYNAQLDETTGKYRANQKALDDYLKSLTRQYELEGAKSKLQELGSAKATATVEYESARANYNNALKTASSGKGRTFTTSYGTVGNTAVDAVSHFEGVLNQANSKLLGIVQQENAILKAYGVDLHKDAINSDSNASGNDNGEGFGGLSDTGSHTSSTSDRFAEEKAWRERQEAEARIAYATGESFFAEHTARMASIAADYYQMLLDRDDLSADERLKFQADYWEAVNKETIAGNNVLLEEENRSYQELLDQLRNNHTARLNQEGISATERQHEAEYYDEVMELAELEHLRKIRNLYETGTDEWLEADRKYQEAQLSAQERHLKRSEALERKHSSMKAQYFGDNPEERQAKYNEDLSVLQEVYARELTAAGDNAAEKLRIEEAFLQAQNALRRQYDLEAENDSRNSMERAIASSVEWLNGDGGKAMSGAVSTLMSGMSSIFSGLSSMVQAELEIQTSKIEKKYDREVELAQGNSYKVAKLEKKKEAEIAKVKNEANKKMFAMQVIQAVAQTAQNALSAYGSAAAIPVVGYILAPIAAAMAVAAGAIQVAAIKKQQQASQAQGYAEGGFTRPGRKDEPAGIVHAGEWVASQKLLANPVARPMIDALEYVQRTNTIGSLRPEDVSRSITANNSLVRIAESGDGSVILAAAASRMSATIDDLTDRLNKPFITINTVTGDHGYKQAEDEYTRLMNNVTPKSKQK